MKVVTGWHAGWSYFCDECDAKRAVVRLEFKNILPVPTHLCTDCLEELKVTLVELS